jgi:hypothetical protein
MGSLENPTVSATVLPNPPRSEPTSPNDPSARAPLFDRAATLETTFQGDRRRGRLRVALGSSADLRESGYGAVYGASVERSAGAGSAGGPGFPALLAQVEPEGQGYENWLGWIQLVNERDPKGRSFSSDHDPIWFLRGKDVPYGATGYAPSFFDAPNRPARKAVVWEADLFLCTVPSVSPEDGRPTSPVEPLAGIRWGFRIDADGADPAPLTPRWTGDWAWASWVPVLRRAFPSWRFADRTPSVSLVASHRP